MADWTNQEIFQIDLDTHEVHAVSGKGDTGFTGVYYDDVREKVIVGQLYESEMVSFNLNGSDRQVFADSGNFLGYQQIHKLLFEYSESVTNKYSNRIFE